MIKYLFLTFVLAVSYADVPRNALHQAKKASQKPVIDGIANDTCWEKATWYPLDQLWVGKAYSKEDFQGRFKLAWTNEKLYLLAEIIDDTLVDTHTNGLEKYWDDDCLEIFLDEDHSGGDHKFSHNAFAYHIALDGKVVDFSPEKKASFYEHLVSKRSQNGKKSVWEVEIDIYNDQYQDGKPNQPVRLSKGKKMGFALAYCDNDSSAEREHFIGSVRVDGEDKNQGYLNASIFGTLTLVK